MDIFFLQAKVPLVKTFQQVGTEIQTSPYPLVSRFTSHKLAIKTLAAMYKAICDQAALGHALLKGKLTKNLVQESRAGATKATDLTEWMLLDVDGLPSYDVTNFLATIGLGEISYIVQYSASMGVFADKGLSCHIFILLDRPINPATLKEWLIKVNISHFVTHVHLNKLNESLHWPVDVTTCQNDKLIYIAPPICIPKTLDSYAEKRIELCQKAKTSFTFPKDFTPIALTELEKLKNDLRATKGLPRSSKLRLDKTSQLTYSPNPNVAQVTGVKVGEEFTHLNLNGGDSWGYYHLTNRPEIIYNFKGEPNYKTSELLPDYWNQLQKTKLIEKTKTIPANRTPLVLRDRQSSTYYTGYYDQFTLTLYDFFPSASKDHVIDFLTNNGVPIPDSISDWICSYDPLSTVAIDITTFKINWFQPSQYMLQPVPSTKIAQQIPIPKSIHTLLQNVLGTDPGIIEHFLHWLAVGFRLRRSTGTAWILQGVPGTGKGMLVNNVLIPLFGKTNTAVKRMSELQDKFNEHLENRLLCFIDEVSIGENRDHDKIIADLKQFITEPTITVRKMRQAAYEVVNYTNWIFSSNNRQPVNIEEGDRRFSVGEYTKVPLKQRVGDTYAFVNQITKDLPALVDYLNSLKLDLNLAATVFSNEARCTIITNSMATIDVLARAINSGDLEKLYEFVDEDKAGEPTRVTLANVYRDMMKELVLTQRDYLTRDELAIICDCLIGPTVPKGAAKFTQYIGHHDIKIKVVRSGNKVVRGIKVNWQCDPKWLAETQADISSNKVTPLRKVQ